MCAAIIAAAARRARALTGDGAVAAWAVGTFTYGAGGWVFTLILLAFFVPSVALSRVGRARKKQLTDIGKSGARDAWQVLANGGVATACALAAASFSSGAWMAAFAGSYAAASADTWGTEIGTLVRGRPRSILTFRPIPTGLSGGVTLTGTLAEIGGAVWIALVAVLSLMRLPNVRPWSFATTRQVFLAVCLGGIAGALVDSLLGATLQELRRCPACERTCETNPHLCGTATLRVRGVAGIGNDVVNAAATLAGAAVAFGMMLR